jgi:hypothetical protein
LELASLATTVIVFDPWVRLIDALQFAVFEPVADPPVADAPFTVTDEIPLFPRPESVAVPDTVIGLVVTVAPLLGLLIVRLGAVVSVAVVKVYVSV